LKPIATSQQQQYYGNTQNKIHSCKKRIKSSISLTNDKLKLCTSVFFNLFSEANSFEAILIAQGTLGQTPEA